MVPGRNFAVDGSDAAIGSDDESGSLGAHVFFAIHAFFDPHAIGLNNPAGLVAQERKGKLVLCDEIRMGGRGVDAHAVDERPLGKDGVDAVAHAASLRRAPGCVVLRVEIKHDGFAAKLRESDGMGLHEGAAHGVGCEIWCSIAGLQGVFHGLENFTAATFAQADGVFFIDCGGREFDPVFGGLVARRG